MQPPKNQTPQQPRLCGKRVLLHQTMTTPTPTSPFEGDFRARLSLEVIQQQGVLVLDGEHCIWKPAVCWSSLAKVTPSCGKLPQEFLAWRIASASSKPPLESLSHAQIVVLCAEVSEGQTADLLSNCPTAPPNRFQVGMVLKSAAKLSWGPSARKRSTSSKRRGGLVRGGCLTQTDGKECHDGTL